MSPAHPIEVRWVTLGLQAPPLPRIAQLQFLLPYAIANKKKASRNRKQTNATSDTAPTNHDTNHYVIVGWMDCPGAPSLTIQLTNHLPEPDPADPG
jgi:hypothetical protein